MRPHLASLRLAALSLAGALLAFLPAGAQADGRFTARYTLTVGGVSVARAVVAGRATATSYELAGTGRVTGVLRVISSGKGDVAARGAIGPNGLNPQVFAFSATADGKDEAVRVAVANGTAKEVDVEPPIKPLPDRIEVTPAHLTSIIDPMSGAFVYVPGSAEMISAAACDRTIPVFDGRQRYDVRLSYLRTEQVKAGKTYASDAVVCRVSYFPVAGHRPTRSTVKYMMENKEMYVWLVPIAGTRLMAPFRISIETMIGTAVFEATSFETEPNAGAAPAPAKP